MVLVRINLKSSMKPSIFLPSVVAVCVGPRVAEDSPTLSSRDAVRVKSFWPQPPRPYPPHSPHVQPGHRPELKVAPKKFSASATTEVLPTGGAGGDR